MSRSRALIRLQFLVICLPFVLMSLVIAFGSTLPARHAFARAVEVPATPDEVFTVVSDIASMPLWSRRVARVLPMPERDGHALWRQIFAADRSASLEVVESTAPTRAVWRLADLGGPYRGSWHFQVEATPAGSRVTLTERAAVGNAVSRFLAHFSAGSTVFVEDHLRDLSTRMGAPAAEVVIVEMEEES